MLRRASSLSFLIAAAIFVPAGLAAVQVQPTGAATASDLAQADLPLQSGLVSLDFQDADIRSVLKVLAFKSGVNIVAAPDVTGVVNIELKDVPWQKALDVILSTYGYGFDRKGNIITVMTVENLKKYREDTLALQAQEPLVSKTFYLSFAKAEEVLKIIDKLASKRGFINYDERTNAVIVRDLESNLELISAVIKSLDTITPQVLIETKVIETDLGANENMGITWGLQLSASGASKPTIFPFTTKAPAGSFNPASTSFAAAPTPGLASANAAGFSYGTINASQLSAALNILSTRSKTHTLSNPRVVTLENEKTVINVGIQYPEATYSFNASTGQEQVTGYTFIPIGVNFEVTPHVNNPGLITLDVHPQISAIDTNVTAPSINNTSFPVLSNEEARTKVMVENGKTLVIAGLITDKVQVTKNKVPLLGDLPFVGQLFRSSTTTKSRVELLIFITPHVITAAQ
jgi:type IV pilus assembly protein PilQ